MSPCKLTFIWLSKDFFNVLQSPLQKENIWSVLQLPKLQIRLHTSLRKRDKLSLPETGCLWKSVTPYRFQRHLNTRRSLVLLGAERSPIAENDRCFVVCYRTNDSENRSTFLLPVRLPRREGSFVGHAVPEVYCWKWSFYEWCLSTLADRMLSFQVALLGWFDRSSCVSTLFCSAFEIVTREGNFMSTFVSEIGQNA